MLTLILCVVVLGACILAVTVEMLSGSGDQPATGEGQVPSGWEPWRSIVVSARNRFVAAVRAAGHGIAVATRRTGAATARQAGAAQVGLRRGVALAAADARRVRSATASGTRAAGRGSARAARFTASQAQSTARATARGTRRAAAATHRGTARLSAAVGHGARRAGRTTKRAAGRVGTALAFRARRAATADRRAAGVPRHAEPTAGRSELPVASPSAVAEHRLTAPGAEAAPLSAVTEHHVPAPGAEAGERAVVTAPPELTFSGRPAPDAPAPELAAWAAVGTIAGAPAPNQPLPALPPPDGPSLRPNGNGSQPPAMAPARAPRRRRRLQGQVVPLRPPATTRLKAVGELLVLVAILGVAASCIIVAIALAANQALANL